MSAVEQKGHRFTELDSLRGLAALAVVLSHFRGALGSSSPKVFTFCAHFLGSGHDAVILFFLLSGFVLTVPYLNATPPSYMAFAVKRVCRIYLPYVAAILIAAAMASRLYLTIPSGNAWVDQTWSKPFSLHLLLAHLLMIGHFDNVQWNTAIWSLIIEMRISLVFPAIAWVTARYKPFVLMTAAVPVTLGSAFVSQRYGHGLMCDTFFYSMLFVAGSLLRRHFANLQNLLGKWSRVKTASLLLLGLACYQCGEMLPLDRIGAPGVLGDYLSDWLTGLGGAVMIILAITSKWLRVMLHGRVLQWLGTNSYSIYLLHGTALFTLIRLHWMDRFSLIMLALYLASVMLSAEIFHRGVELPALALGRRVGLRRVALGPVRRRDADRNDVCIRAKTKCGDLSTTPCDETARLRSR